MTYQITGSCSATLQAGNGETVELEESKFSMAIPIE